MKRVHFLAGALAAAAAPMPAFAQSRLAAQIDGIIKQMPGSVGVFARTMADGPPLYAYNAQTSFPSASTIKMLIMLTAFRAAEHDPAVMRARIRFNRGRDLIGGSEFMSRQPDGATFSVHELILPMIQVSDNTASNMLITHFGFGPINAAAQRAGMHQTHLKRHFMDTAAILRHMDNRTTPRDMAHLLFLIERSVREGYRTVASPISCRQMIQIMLGQEDRVAIPRLLPHSVAVANKTGELSRSRNDVAIVDPLGDSPYVIAVYVTDLSSPESANVGIARISRAVYSAVAQTEL